jgi:hypothetical protein
MDSAATPLFRKGSTMIWTTSRTGPWDWTSGFFSLLYLQWQSVLGVEEFINYESPDC